MNSFTLDSLNSDITKLYEIDGKVIVGIDLNDVLSGKVTISTTSQVQTDEFLEEAPPLDMDGVPSVVITDDIKAIYSNLGQDRGEKMYDDVYTYLQLAASCWESSNKSTSAITGSLIGKISKPFSELNELLFRVCGGVRRDAYLKELIKVNMPLMEYFWGLKK